MSTPEIKGWCPGALRPMMSGDGLVVRIRPRLAQLSQTQAAGIADLSKQYGNGLIDLSARANVQLRGVRNDTHAPLINGLRDLGLVDGDATLEARRNITVTPFWTPGDDSQQIATALETALAAPDAPALPGKFGFAVDCGDAPVLQGTSADIRIERGRDGLICRADGMETGKQVSAANAPQAAIALARWFIETGGAPDGRGRMARHLEQGAALPDGYAQASARIENFDAAPTYTPQGQLVGFEFGQMGAGTLASLAEAGDLRITPWRMVLIEGGLAPERTELITQPDDPRLRVTACTGAPGCPQAKGPTRAIARALARRIAPDQHLHVSGCAKGCAHPGPTDLTLVATGPGRYDLIRNGRAADTPALTGLTEDTMTKALNAPQL